MCDTTRSRRLDKDRPILAGLLLQSSLIVVFIEMHVTLCVLQGAHTLTLTGLLPQSFLIEASLLGDAWNSAIVPADVHRYGNTVLKTQFQNNVQ